MPPFILEFDVGSKFEDNVLGKNASCMFFKWNCMFSGRAVNFDLLITISIILFGCVWF